MISISADDLDMVMLQVMMLVNLLVTNIPRCIYHNVKTIRLYHLQLPHVGMGSRSSKSAYKVHHRINGLFIKQNTITDSVGHFTIKDRSLYGPPPDNIPKQFSSISSIT